jgi:isocitrate dehydrogenase
VRLRAAVLETIESGVMTRDLAILHEGDVKAASSADFLAAVRTRL